MKEIRKLGQFHPWMVTVNEEGPDILLDTYP